MSIISRFGRNGSNKSCSGTDANGEAGSKPKMKMNAHFMKKLPKGAEASNILVSRSLSILLIVVKDVSKVSMIRYRV